MLELKRIKYSVVDIDGKVVDVLKDINLNFDKGITVITGQNGSGKSSLVKIIMGINNVYEGKILYNRKDISAMSVNERAKLGFTLAFQQPVKFKGVKVKDLLDIATSQTNKLADACEYLSKVGLCAKDYISREVDDTLSGGELKRIELAMALAKGGKVFLFDEPEAGIDLWSFEKLIQIFNNLRDKIVIIVSHQKKIIECADNVVLIDNNGIAQYNSKQAIKQIERLQCGRLGG